MEKGTPTQSSAPRLPSTESTKKGPSAPSFGARARSTVAKMGYAEGSQFLSPDGGRGGAGGGIPFAAEIQRSFGHHDVSGLQARVGGRAAVEAERLGAEAYTTGREMTFAAEPDLRTAAHEAAHAVQQASGRRREGALDRATDRFERNADDVADKVVRGEDAEGLLDRVVAVSPEVPAVQRKKKKGVSGKAAKRLPLAQDAIRHTKSVIAFGAGNQYDALKKTHFNTYYRLLVMRGSQYWEIDPSVKPLAAQYPEALTAAKADLAKGGNCGEHAEVAFDYLRVKAVGETLSLSDVEGLDHAFVLLGDLSTDGDHDLVVSDPWPTKATACLWEDHFAHVADRKKVHVRRSTVADGQNVKEVIARGLRLKPEGKALLERQLTPEQTQNELEKGSDPSSGHPWIWQHPRTTGPGRDYAYTRQNGQSRR